MRIIIWLGIAIAWAGRTATAQPRPSSPTRARAPVGLLIGFERGVADDTDEPGVARPAPGDGHAANTVSRDDTLARGQILHHVATTAQADRLATLWVLVADQHVKTRLVQHIVVPRASGFWALGSNSDSAVLVVHADSSSLPDFSRSEIDDFFWLAPLAQVPRLPMVASEDVACVDGSKTGSLTYVGPEYVGYSTFAQATCAHYDESNSMAVESLDTMYASRAEGTVAPTAAVALLGSEAAARLASLNRAAAHWSSDCGADGYAAGEGDWTIRRARTRWQAVALFTGTGGGICGRYTVERVLSRSLPRSIASPEAPLPVSWSAIKASVPAAVDATASPDGRVVVVFEPRAVTVMAVERGKARRLGAPIRLAGKNVVMLEWARGDRATRWDEVLSTLPMLQRVR